MIIRECTKSDFDEVNRLMQQQHQFHLAGVPDFFLPLEQVYSAERYDTLLHDPAAMQLGAEADGKLIAYCHIELREKSGMVDMKNAHIANLVVDEVCRGQGIGRAVIAEVETRAKAWGAKQLNLLVWEFNDGARRLYESLGMRPQKTDMIKEL